MLDSKNKIRFMMVFATIFWAGAFIAGKYSSAEIPAVSLTFYRMLFAFIGICIVRLMANDRGWKISKNDAIPILIMTLSGMIGYHVLFFVALKYTSATNTSIIAAINPIVTMIIGVLIFKEKIKSKNVFALILSFLGILIIFTNGDFSKLDIKHVGDLIMFVAVVLWVIYSYVSKTMLKKYSPLKLTALIFGLAALILLPFALFEAGTKFNLLEVSKMGWMSVLYMAIFPSVIGYLIQQISIKEIGPIKTAQFINLVPVFSMIMAYFILDESIGFTQIMAFLLVISGIILNNSN